MDFIINLLIRILLTAAAYMIFPLSRLIINGGKFEKTKAKKIALWNSIVLGLVFCIVTIEFSDGGTVWNAGPAVLYYWINRTLLTRKKAPELPTSPSTPITTSTDTLTAHSLSSADDKKPAPAGYDFYGSEFRVTRPTAPEPSLQATPTSPKNNTKKVGNYGIIETSLASGFTENARNIIKQQISKAITERSLARKTDLMKIVFGHINQEFANAKGPKVDIIVCAYYQIAFDEIVERCGDTNDLIFNYAVAKKLGTINQDIHQYLQMVVRIQLLIDNAIISAKNCNEFCGYLKQLKSQVFNELNSYVDDKTNWNKLDI